MTTTPTQTHSRGISTRAAFKCLIIRHLRPLDRIRRLKKPIIEAKPLPEEEASLQNLRLFVTTRSCCFRALHAVDELGRAPKAFSTYVESFRSDA